MEHSCPQPRQVAALAFILGSALTLGVGCRGHQYGHIVADEQSDIIGSHAAGSATFNPLIDEAVGKLLARQHVSGVADHGTAVEPANYLAPKRICFVGIENYSSEELGDFKDQIFEQIDGMISQSDSFQPISHRFVRAGLEQTRLRPDALFVPSNMQAFTHAMEQQGQPFDYLLYAKLTSGTTDRNRDYQRDYLLTLELVDITTGDFDKESAKIRKGYHKTRLGKIRNYNPFTRR